MSSQKVEFIGCLGFGILFEMYDVYQPKKVQDNEKTMADPTNYIYHRSFSSLRLGEGSRCMFSTGPAL